MSSSSRADLELDTCIRRRDAVRELGRRALGETDLDGLLKGATERAAEALDADLAAVFQRQEDDDGLLLRAGVGWRDGAVGAERVPSGSGSQAGYTLSDGRRVVADDLQSESRFSRPELLADHDVASGISVVVGPPDDPWGVLAAHATAEGAFAEHDVGFLDSVANVLGGAVETERAERRLQRELEAVHGRVTDAVYALDEEWRFTYANERAEELLGRSEDDLRGEVAWDVVPDAEGSALEERFREAMETQAPVSFERYSEPLDGWVQVEAYPSETGLSVYVRDVTERKERERQLQRFESLVTESRDVNVILGPDGTYRYVPPSMADEFGHDPAALRGESAFDYVHPDDRERVFEEFSALVEDPERAPTVEYRFRRADGSWAHLESRGRNLLDEPGVEGVVVYSRDVTERKELEQEVHERERRLSTLMESVPGMVYRCRNERGWPMEFVSEGCRELTGYDPAALEAGELSFGDDIVVEEDRDELWEGVQRGLDDGETFLVTYRVETADGEVRWVRERGRGIYDEDGSLAAIEGVIIDVTERKRLGSELDEIFGRITDAFYALDEEYRFTHVNERAEELLGRSEAELLGEEFWEVFPEAADVEDVREAFHEAMETQEPTSYELYFDRLEFWVEASIYPSDTGVSVYFRDVTERKERKRELAQYETIVETVNDGIYVVDEDGRFAMVNEAYTELTGYSREELLGEHVSLIVEDDVAERARRAGPAMREGDADDAVVEADLKTASGDRIPSEATFAMLPGHDDGERRVGVARDVSDRHERERELRRKERRFEAIFEDPNILVGLLEPDGTVLDINGTAMEYIDADLDDVTGEAFWETPWWGAGDGAGDDVREWTERAAAGEYVDFEADLTRPDGERYTLSGYFRPVTNDDGEVVSIIVSDRDVTERKRRERELEESERRYRTLVEHFPNGAVALVDEHLRYQTVGGTPIDEEGDTVDTLEGKPVGEALSPDLADVLEPRYRAAIDGEMSAFEHEHDGEHFRFQVFPVRDDDGDVFAAIGVSQDITEQVERERALERSERRYRTIAEYFPNGIVTLFGADLEYTLAAGQGFDRIPVDPGDLEGRHVGAAWDDETAAALQPALEAALDGEERSVELGYEGREWVVHAVPIADERGDVFAGMTMAQDVTERKRFEEAIRSLHDTSRELFRAESAEEVGDMVVTAAADVLGLSDAALYLHDDDRGDLYPAARATRVGMMWDDLPRVPPGDDSLVGHVYATGEGVRWDDVREAPQFIGAETEMRAGVFAPVGEHGAVFAGSDEVGAFDDRTLQLLELLGANAEAAFDRIERERDLREIKTQLEAATEAGAVGTWEWHVQEDEMVMGPSFARSFGVDPEVAREGVPLESFISSIHEDDRERVRRKIDEALASCGEYEAEYRVRNDDDELRWVVARGLVECDGDGTPVRFPGALTDITERKRAELELQRTNDQLETLFDVLPVGVVVADGDGELVEVNDTAREIWGGGVFDAGSVEEYDEYTMRRADSGELVTPEEMTLARVIEGEAVTDPDVYEIDAQDGERRIVSVEGMPIRDEDGAVVRGVVTLTDVTERRENQRALEESERRYRTLVENFPDGAVGLFDEDLEYTVVGGQFLEKVDVEPEERVGNSLFEIYPDELLADIEGNFRATFDGETNSFEAELYGRHLYAHTLPVRNGDDEIFAGMVVVQDVTERREYERMLEESNERLEQFAYAASHDLQEPLRMVSSYLQLVEQRYAADLDADGREFIEYAVDGADRMRNMIDGLLQYSRVETQGDPFEAVDLDAVFADVRRDLAVRIEESDAEVTAESLPRVEGDGSQLNQVFQNLLSNAIEYSGDDPPRIHVSANRPHATDDEWVISVRDEGIGIDPEDEERVFEVFQSLHDQGEHSGTGIGLALCERIVERHDGEIWVDSAPGEGATFSFTLPEAGDNDE